MGYLVKNGVYILLEKGDWLKVMDELNGLYGLENECELLHTPGFGDFGRRIEVEANVPSPPPTRAEIDILPGFNPCFEVIGAFLVMPRP
jgi:hypothetical protein